MRKYLAGLIVAAGCVAATTAVAEEKVSSLLTILTAPEPQTQLMAMVLSMQSLQKGVQPHILLCGPAGDIALKAAPEGATAPQKPKDMSPQGLMKMIMAKGGKVEVCAIYLPNNGIGADALIDGVTSAAPPAIADRLLAENTRVMSF